MDGKPARSVTLTDFERDAVKHLCLLTMKPVIYVANVAESDLADPANNNYVKDVTNVVSELQSRIVTISAQVYICLEGFLRSLYCQVNSKKIGPNRLVGPENWSGNWFK